MQMALFETDRLLRSGPAEVGYRMSKAVLNRGVGALAGVDFTLNPYVGCQFGCSYCYAKFFHPDEERVARWGQWVDVKENVLTLLMRRRDLAGKKILIGSATDPYQPIEAKLGLTRSIVSFLATLRPLPKVCILTRSPLAARDIDIFQRIPELRLSLSITTDDDEVRKAFEPGCPSIERRFATLKALVDGGIEAGASLAPLLPMRDPAEFVGRLATIGVRRAWTATFHSGTEPFRAGTGALARDIAERLAWTPEAMERTANLVRAAIAQHGLGGRG